MKVYVDEAAIVMAIFKIVNMEGKITRNSVYVQGSFKGNSTSCKAQIENILNGWEDSGILTSTSKASGSSTAKYYEIADDGVAELQKIRTAKAEWLVEAEDLIESYGSELPVPWGVFLEKAATKQAHRAWFQKVYLPWLKNDNYWLLDVDDESGQSVNRQGYKKKLIPSCGFH